MTELVGVIMGSKSDWETMTHAAQMLEHLGISFEVQVVSAHRTPDLMFEYAAAAAGRGLEVIIAGAGGAAHLPGMVAAKTCLPVLGVPIETKALGGLDSLLSIVQMPAGVPVGGLCYAFASCYAFGPVLGGMIRIPPSATAAELANRRAVGESHGKKNHTFTKITIQISSATAPIHSICLNLRSDSAWHRSRSGPPVVVMLHLAVTEVVRSPLFPILRSCLSCVQLPRFIQSAPSSRIGCDRS